MSISAEIIKAEWDHIDPIAKNMRNDDVTEVWHSANFTPHQAVRLSFQKSVKSWTIMLEGEPIGMFGLATPNVLGELGVPWLLGTNGMLKIRKQFVKESGKYVEEMLGMYPKLTNFVHSSNAASMRWLSWLGFEIVGPCHIGPDDELFYHFTRFADV